MSKETSNLSKQERSLINKCANVFKQLAYETYQIHLTKWAAQRKSKTGQMITADDLAQFGPDVSLDIR